MALQLSGTYTSGYTLTSASQNPVTVLASGSISGGANVGLYGLAPVPWTISNLGSITGVTGIKLDAGGTITNGDATHANALIGYSLFGIQVTGGSGTVRNYGSISHADTLIELDAGGTVVNHGAIENFYSGNYGVRIAGGVGTVMNFGGIGVSAYTDYPPPGPFHAVAFLEGGNLTNGCAADTGAYISASGYAVILGGPGVVTNFGTIAGSASGNAAGSYPNLGIGISLASGGTVTNGTRSDTQAAIFGYRDGIAGAGAVTVENYGTVSTGNHYEYFDGVSLTGHVVDVVANGRAGAPQATIIGKGYGVYLGSDRATVENAGTISGGVASVRFGNGTDRLIVYPGAVFVGNVLGGTGSNTLELASAASPGTIGGLGTSFTNFGTIVVDAGAAWTLVGTNSLANGTIDVAANTTLTVAGWLQASGGLALHGGTLALGGGGMGSIEVGAAGGAATGRITVDAGMTLAGNGQLSGAVSDAGTIEASGGTLTFGGKVAGSGTLAIAAGAALTAPSAVRTWTMQFLAGGNETLNLRTPSEVTSQITGFGAGNTIDLLRTIVTSASFAGHMLTVSGAGGSVAALRFAGSYKSANFVLRSDHHGGTDITFKHV